MKFVPTSIPEVVCVEFPVFQDERGSFAETFHAAQLASAGVPDRFVQDNQSGSHKNTLRGLHYQIRQAQGKLVRAVHGEIFDVAVDLRRSSRSFGKWVGKVLSAENRTMLWIPPGFAHGLLVLSEWADVLYKTTDYYSPTSERTIIWNDPNLAIQWPLVSGQMPILSPKDASGSTLNIAEVYD